MCMQNWDGSGGNGAAMRHFEATGQKYPLVVKLGTITPNGADVYSYASDENDMVEDPDLVCAPEGLVRLAPVFPGTAQACGGSVGNHSDQRVDSDEAVYGAGEALGALGHQHDVHAEDREDHGGAADRPEHVLRV